MDPTPVEKPPSTDASSSERSEERSTKGETQSETNQDTHEHIQAELRAVLEEVTTGLRPFEETVFTKIDAMQEKIDQLDHSVADLSVTAKQAEAASAGDGSPSEGVKQGASDHSSAPGP